MFTPADLNAVFAAHSRAENLSVAAIINGRGIPAPLVGHTKKYLKSAKDAVAKFSQNTETLEGLQRSGDEQAQKLAKKIYAQAGKFVVGVCEGKQLTIYTTHLVSFLVDETFLQTPGMLPKLMAFADQIENLNAIRKRTETAMIRVTKNFPKSVNAQPGLVDIDTCYNAILAAQNAVMFSKDTNKNLSHHIGNGYGTYKRFFERANCTENEIDAHLDDVYSLRDKAMQTIDDICDGIRSRADAIGLQDMHMPALHQ
ncbi:MAG TPA: hypothetical protein VGE32_08455, partial [Cellvibrio sp.]